MSDNPFALSNIEPQQDSAPASDNPFALGAIQRDQRQDLRVNLESAVRTNPQQAAEAARLAKKYETPDEVLLRNLQDVKLRDAVAEADKKLQTSPRLADYMRTSPFALKQAHDDLGALVAIEEAVTPRTLLGTAQDIGVTALKGAVGLPQAFVGLADIVSGGYAGKAVEAIGVRFNDTQNILDTLYSPAQQKANAAVAEADGFVSTIEAMLSNPSTIATAAGESVPQMLGGAAVGRGILAAAPKVAPWLAAAMGEGVMGAGSAAENMRSQSDDGLLGARQTLAAVASGAGTTLFGTIGGKAAARLGLADMDTALVTKGVDAATAKTLQQGFAASVVKAGISEGIFEELPQSVQEQMWQNFAADRPLGEGVGKVAAQGLLAGASMGSGFQVLSDSAQRVSDRIGKVQQARDEVDKLMAAMQAAEASTLRTNNPDEFRAVMEHLAQDGKVYVDAQVLNQLPPEQLQALGVAESLPEALAANSSVEVKLSDLLTHAPGTPAAQVLIDNARATPDGLSAIEVQQASDQAGEFIKTEAERVLAEAQDATAWQDSTNKVKQGVLDQLNSAGRFSPEVNEAYATLQSSFFSVMAQRLGTTPEELFARYNLRVEAKLPGQGVWLDQGGDVGLALNTLTRDDLEDDQVFSKPLPDVDSEDLGYVKKLGANSVGSGGFHVYVKGEDVREAGPHEFYFYDNSDEPIGFARLTKTRDQASVNMIAFTEDARGSGYGKAFYRYLLDELGVSVKSDKEITEGTAALYRSLAKEYGASVDSDGRVVISKQLNQSAEQPRLMAVHNLSAENLIFADKMGGLAVPSIGVVTQDAGAVDGFGEITLIGRKGLVDPKQERVFSADAYTVRFPKPEWPKVKSKDAQALVDFVRAAAKEFNDHGLTNETFDYMVNTPDASKVVETWLSSSAVRAVFLRERGVDAQPVTRDTKPETSLTSSQLAEVKDLFDATMVKWRNGQRDTAELTELAAKVETMVRSNLATEGLEGAIVDEFASVVAEGLPRNLYRDYAKSQVTADVDIWGTKTKLNELIEPRAAEFKQWVESKIIPKFGDPFIKVGRKKAPYTLGNIVEVMTDTKVKGKEKTMTYGAGQVRAASSIEFSDLDQMRAAAVENVVDPAQYEAAKAETEKKLEDYRSAVVEFTNVTNWKGDPDTWEAMDASMRALAKWSTGKKRDATSMKAALRAEDFNVAKIPDSVIEQAMDAAGALLRAPVPYFEAKPQRAVSLGEFAGAVIPTDAPQQVRDILAKNNVPVTEYEPGADRASTAREFAAQLAGQGQDTLFQTATPAPTSLPAEINIDGKQRPTTNSNGQPIAATEEGVRNFWKWFGDSKVVDASGKPLVVYHGSRADFAEFGNVGGRFKISDGYYFTTSTARASVYADSMANAAVGWNPKSTFAKPVEEGANVVPVYLKAGNPLTLTDKDGFNVPEEAFDHNKGALVAAAKTLGHDSVVFHRQKGDGYDETAAVVFTPEQIKSAIGNSGEFDPSNPSILAQSPAQSLPATINIDGKQRPTTNSNGQPIAATEEGVRNFWKWFGESAATERAVSSKQRRNELRPLVVYHGTRASFDSFAPVREGNVTTMFGDEETVTRHGIFFAETSEFADTFAKQAGEGNANVVPVYLKIENPLYLDEGFTDEVISELVAAGLPDEQAARLRYRKADMAWAEFDDEAGAAMVSAIRAAGYDGALMVEPGVGVEGEDAQTVWVALDPTQIKSAISNSGEFDPANPSILAQNSQAPRGTYSPSQVLITLGESADLSTFLHESGHFFLEVMADLASQPDAPAGVVDDFNTFLKWAGVPDAATWNAMTLDQKRPYHEKWAESFEQYLLEGKAPTAELQPLFRRFSAWLKNVYKSLTEFMRSRNLQVSDEIRGVFDRMLAAEDQIKAAEQAAGMLPDFEATNEAIEKLQARSLRDLKWTVGARSKALKALQREAANLRKAVEAEVRAEVEQQPIYRAMHWLKKGKTTDPATGETVKADKGFRLNTAALVEMFPETMLARPDLAGLKGMTSKDGLHPDIVADMFGFANGETLVRSILDVEPMASVIEGKTDQRMLENFGELATPEALEAAANDAVHNEARARALATELKAQADMLNPRQDTGRTASNGRSITVNALTAAAKQFAQNLTARRRVKDLKNAAWQHRSAESRAAKAWQEATAKGKTEEAVAAKRDQLLNNYTAKAMGEAQAEVRKVLEFFAKVTKGNNEKLVDKGRDPDVVNAARAVLAAYDIAPRLEKTANDYMEAVAKYDAQMYGALKPGLDAMLANAKPFGELTVDEMRALRDEIGSMWELAKTSRQMEIDGDRVDIDDAAQDLVNRMVEIGVPDEIPGEKGAITNRQELGIKLQFAKAILSRVEQWAERMDGKFGGPFLRYVFQPVKDAADRYRTARVQHREKFTKLVEGVAPFIKPGPIAAPELGYTFGNARDSGMAELLHALIHTGNDSNKRKLLLGRNWATENADGTLDTTRWDTFVARLISEGTLRKEHYDFAQGVWDLLEETKPLAQEAHRKVFGRYFAEVTANEFTTPFGVYRGGYAPAQTDSRLVGDAKLRELAEGENESMAYAFPSAPSGFTKSRVEYNKPLLLDLRALAQHMDKVLLFSHMQPAISDARRLLTRKNVSYALDRIDPGAYEGMLMPWLNRSAKQIVETPIAGDRRISRFMGAVRSRAGMALMMANLSNTVQQITGFSTAAIKVKPSLMLKAVGQFTASPKEFKRSVAEASAYMKDRMLNEVSTMNDAVEQILVDPTLLEKGQAWTQKHAYFLQSAVDNTMSPIIWTAAYNQAIEEGSEARDAVRFADGVIRQTQGSTLPEDVSRFETGDARARFFTQFIGYFNMMANTNATAVSQIANEMGLRKGAGKLLYTALVGLLVPIWVAEAIAQAFRGGPGDEDDDGYLDDWLMAVFGLGTIRGLTATVPIAGQGAQMIVSRFNNNPADDKFSLSPAISLLEATASSPFSVYNAIIEDGNAQKAVRDVAAAATLLTGLPFYAAARPVGYAAGVAQGKIEPTDAVDAVRGTVTGTASKESKTP